MTNEKARIACSTFQRERDDQIRRLRKEGGMWNTYGTDEVEITTKSHDPNPMSKHVMIDCTAVLLTYSCL